MPARITSPPASWLPPRGSPERQRARRRADQRLEVQERPRELGRDARLSVWRMAASLDEIDVRLLKELETDADRPNVALARIVGLSPAATMNRVRRLKESGVIRRITARLDSATAGFTLHVYVAITLARHDEAAHRRFVREVRELDNVISADWVTGETDALLMIAARDVAELQLVLLRLSMRGGAQRMITLLRLEELKPASPLPLRATSGQSRRAA
jgi:Lrp/AsnC family leucine-responsive transcriptional regulator